MIIDQAKYRILRIKSWPSLTVFAVCLYNSATKRMNQLSTACFQLYCTLYTLYMWTWYVNKKGWFCILISSQKVFKRIGEWERVKIVNHAMILIIVTREWPTWIKLVIKMYALFLYKLTYTFTYYTPCFNILLVIRWTKAG